jgi:hypothetical protein
VPKLRDWAVRITLRWLLSVSPILAGAVLLSSASARAETDASRQLWMAAQQCSETALRRYALSSTDPAEKVAEAAFEKCRELWRIPAEIEGREADTSVAMREGQKNCERLRGSSCPPALPYSVYLLNAAERQFVVNASTKVFDIRAEAADKERGQKP